MQMWVKDIDVTQRNDREALEIWLDPARNVWNTDVVFQNVLPKFEYKMRKKSKAPAQLVTHGVCDRIGRTLFRRNAFSDNCLFAWYQLDTTDDYAQLYDEFLGYPHEVSITEDSDFWNLILRVALIRDTVPPGDELCIKLTQNGNSMLANMRVVDLNWHLEMNKEAVDYCMGKEDWEIFKKRMEGKWLEIPS